MSEDKRKKKIQELIENGTPKNKALALCKDYYEVKSMRMEPIITEEEAMEIKNSFKEDSEGKKEFLNWLHIYGVFDELTPLIGLVYKEYEAGAEKIVGYLREWEAYNSEENHLNTLYEALLDSGDSMGLERFREALGYLKFTNAELTTDKEGYIILNVDKLYNKIQEEIGVVIQSYKTAKAIVLATEKYIRKTRSSAFVIGLMKVAINHIKGDYSLKVAPRYSRRVLREREAKGLKVSPDERRRAVFPTYEEIKAEPNMVKYFENRIKNIDRNV